MLTKEQQKIVRSARYCLTAGGSFVYSWLTMVKRAINEPDYMGQIITFSRDTGNYYIECISYYAQEHIKRKSFIGYHMGYIDFKSGARIHIFCHDPPISTLGMHVQQILIDERTSNKKPLTEILRKS